MCRTPELGYVCPHIAKANSLYADPTGAIERLGPGLARRRTRRPLGLVKVDGQIRTLSGSEVQVTLDEKGSRIDSVTLVV